MNMHVHIYPGNDDLPERSLMVSIILSPHILLFLIEFKQTH